MLRQACRSSVAQVRLVHERTLLFANRGIIPILTCHSTPGGVQRWRHNVTPSSRQTLKPDPNATTSVEIGRQNSCLCVCVLSAVCVPLRSGLALYSGGGMSKLRDDARKVLLSLLPLIDLQP